MRRRMRFGFKLVAVIGVLAGISVLLSPPPSGGSPYVSALSSLTVVSDATAARCTHVFCKFLTYCTQGDRSRLTNCVQDTETTCHSVSC